MTDGAAMLRRVELGLGSAAGLGFLPIAPSAAASAAGLLIVWLLSGSSSYLIWIVGVVLLLQLAVLAISSGTAADLERREPSGLVLPSTVGVLVACAWIVGPSLLALAVAFCLFRGLLASGPPLVGLALRDDERSPRGVPELLAGVWTLLLLGILRSTLFEPAVWSAEIS